MRVLLIEDDQRLTTALRESLRSEGYAVDVAGTAEDGRWMATEVPYDTIVLDVGLPDGDGIDLCAALRDGGVWAPILVLTAHAEIRDRVRGLDSGADDYLAKPFSFDELIARVRALLRRGQVERPSILTVGTMRLDPATRRVSVDRQPLPITGRAFAILELLARRKGQLVTRAEIMEHVWDWAWDGVSNVIDVHVSALRAILREVPGAPLIETVRGAGFLLRAQDDHENETSA
jgi:two-component system OmpR family response regulator